MSDFENLETPTGDPVDSINLENEVKPRKRRWIKWSVAGVVLALVVGYQAFAAKPEVRIYKAITNWINLADSDNSISVVVTPELFTAAGVTDAQIAQSNLPGIKTVSDAVSAINSIKLQTLGHKGDSAVNDNAWLSAQYGGQRILQLGVVDRNLYLQLSLQNLVAAQPQVVTEAQINSTLMQLQLLQASGFSFIGDLVDGKMLKLSLASGTPLGDIWDKAQAPTSGPDSSTVAQVQKVLSDGLRSASSVSSDGSANGLDKFIISIDGSKFADATADSLFSAISALNSSLDTKAEYKKALQGTTFKIRLWLDGDTIKEMDFDLISLARSLDKNSTMPKISDWASYVRLEMGDQKISTPSDAVDVTEQINALVGALGQ